MLGGFIRGLVAGYVRRDSAAADAVLTLVPYAIGTELRYTSDRIVFFFATLFALAGIGTYSLLAFLVPGAL